MQHLPQFVPVLRSAGIRMSKLELVQALKRLEAKSISLAAENDRLRHALAIEQANNQFRTVRDKAAL